MLIVMIGVQYTCCQFEPRLCVVHFAADFPVSCLSAVTPWRDLWRTPQEFHDPNNSQSIANAMRYKM